MKKQYLCILLFSFLIGIFIPIPKVFGQDTAILKGTGDNTPAVTGLSYENNNHRVAACGPAPNDNFASATPLIVGVALAGQTTCSGSLEAGESTDCNSAYAPQTSVWYIFTATAATMYINLSLQSGTFFLGFELWNTSALPTGTCHPIDCFDQAAGILNSTLEATNLTIGQNYYIQVLDPKNNDQNLFTVAVTLIPSFTVYEPAPVNTCATAVPGCYINSFNPSVATIEATCPGYQFQNPPYPVNAGYPNGGLKKGYVYSLCYSFTNLNTSATLNIQSLLFTCAGNSYWLDWTLYNSVCGLMSCGTLSNMTVSGVACNTQYTICETFQAACNFDNNVPATNGSQMGIIPYSSWPSASPATCSVLPIQLGSFSIDYDQASSSVLLDWSTATETNNDFFTAEKSVDGSNWEAIAKVNSKATNGASSQPLYYSATDESPYLGVSYYRLKQTDLDGQFTYSNLVPLSLSASYSAHIFPNPTTGDLTLRYTSQSSDPVHLTIRDISGQVSSDYSINQVQQGVNNFDIPTSTLASGMYILQVSNQQKTFYLKFVKE
jgi:hypothetical protein